MYELASTKIRPTSVISESHPRFQELANDMEKAAVARSQQSAKEEPTLNSTKATYKIEVVYGESRKLSGSSLCSVVVWESGNKFHGGGDTSMFWCLNPNTESEESGCGGIIPSACVTKVIANCPHCKHTVNRDMLPTMRVGKFSAKKLAQELARLYRHLHCNADIYMKVHTSDGENYRKAKNVGRQTPKAVMYLNEAILKDTLSGADLAGRIEAFLTA
jgi:hypothetical protein